jgi:hypothetical protein
MSETNDLAAAMMQITDEDPGVQSGLFSHELHPVRGLPGSSLP